MIINYQVRKTDIDVSEAVRYTLLAFSFKDRKNCCFSLIHIKKQEALPA
jgi:hypothetical protein